MISSVESTIEADYEVSTRPGEFGALRSLRFLGGEGKPGRSARCYRTLRDRSSPCGDCPVAGLEVGQTHLKVRVVHSHPEAYEVATATAVGRGRARVQLRMVSADALTAIREARVAELAAHAHLSQREREVLGYLLIGRTLAEIAALLRIGSRTVKFHQANILAKLGVESRGDLLRLVF